MFEGNWNFPFESVINYKDQAIKEFRENSKPLENIIEFCFDNDIETLSCCAGHDDLKFATAYITFVLNDKTINYINNLLEYFLEEKKLNYFGDLKSSYESGDFVMFNEYIAQVPGSHMFSNSRIIKDNEKRSFGFYFNGKTRNEKLKKVYEILKYTKITQGPYQYNGILNLSDMIKKNKNNTSENIVNEDIKFLMEKANYSEEKYIKKLSL